jgi:acyl-CoA synthetase (AMP-forming)/AMP-acid ligase II/acyl carrier protein
MSSTATETLSHLLDVTVSRSGSSLALRAPGKRQELSYADLLRQVEVISRSLAAAGVRSGDRVAICLPDGPEMVTAFLGVSSVVASAPLNPAYRQEEFAFYLSDLQPRALLLLAGSESPARQAAEQLGVAVLELVPDAETVGLFQFASDGDSHEPLPAAAPDDVALLLHTSGTTSRPKLVPLTQRNLCASAEHIVRTLQLSVEDRCLNVMPLFHIHGLIAATLSSLRAGGSVVCTPGFLAPQFFDWLDEFRPTWYTAVPTMHQAILARASGHRGLRGSSALRFLRSSSAALPPRLFHELEEAFDAPVIEAYGMTEAAHQMASNPLPPSARKAGSVGLPAGPQIAVLDERGRPAGPEQRGEIVIRGPNVTQGYLANPSANSESFVEGWFRTGDQGYFDEEGYLFLTGRLKEIVNRGGEKISPREIDELLLEHPAVAQAVAFGFPHHELGEELAAAIVLRDGATATERELREFVSTRVVNFKVPRRIAIVSAIPKGPTGKLQRIGLAAKLGITEEIPPSSSQPRVPPRTALEEDLVRIWREVLRVDGFGVEDDFLVLGGDSILATQIVARLRETFRVDISILDFFEAGTIAGLAKLLEIQTKDATEGLHSGRPPA